MKLDFFFFIPVKKENVLRATRGTRFARITLDLHTLKWIVLLKSEILLSFTHPDVVSNQHDLLLGNIQYLSLI